MASRTSSPEQRGARASPERDGSATTTAAASAASPAAAQRLSSSVPWRDRERIGDATLACVVKLFVVKVKPVFSLPWQRSSPRESRGSGFSISGRRLVSNAHCVLDATNVRCRRHGSAKKYKARVLAVCVQLDLALLTVDDDDFWRGLGTLEFGALPQLQETVTVVGYPLGGDTLSVTRGVVSRVDLSRYSTYFTALAVQVDAAINPGNSGGPAIKESTVVGVAFSGLTHAENVGYIIPADLVKHFLRLVQAAVPTSASSTTTTITIPEFGADVQKMEHDALRSYHKMTPQQSGVRVTRINPLHPVSKVLRTGDVILTLDDVVIADDGTVALRRDERVGFSHLLDQTAIGDVIKVTILRDGRVLEQAMTLGLTRDLLPLMHGYDAEPSYVIIGGLVFTRLSLPFLASHYGSKWRKSAPPRLLVYETQFPTDPQHQIVVLIRVLTHEVNYGCTVHSPLRLLSVNGQDIHNMQDLVAAYQREKTPFMRFDLENEKLIVLDTAKARAAEAEILKQHQIPRAVSDDLTLP